MKKIDEDFWNQRYEAHQTGWDMGRLSPPLKNYIDSIDDKKMSILIPGCGNAYEASYLLELGFTKVTLLDISSYLVNKLKHRFADKPIRIIHDDFFLQQGKYDLMLEQTFFCAIAPLMRSDYVRHTHSLLNDGGKIAGVLFNENVGYEDRPPFRGTEEEYRRHFEPYFEILKMEVAGDSIEPRMGNELFIEMRKRELDSQ